MEDRLGKLEQLITRNTEAAKWGRSDAKRVGKAVAGNKEHIQLVFENLNDQTRMINTRLAKLGAANTRTRNIESEHQRQIEILQKTIEGHQNSITLLLELDHQRLNRQVAKQTERNAKKDNSAWSKVKRLLPYKDELAHKYIVD